MDSQYCILWNNYHRYIADSMQQLQIANQLVDVTLVTSEGVTINAHKIVLAACSSFFMKFLKQNHSNHSCILLPSDIKYPEMKAMIEFMYTGQVCVQQHRLEDFIKGARYFRIKGLEDSNEGSDEEEGTDNASGDRFLHLNKSDFDSGRFNLESRTTAKVDQEQVPLTSVKGKTVKDHRYTQLVDMCDSDENREKWQVIERKPVVFARSVSGKRKKQRRLSTLSKRPVHLSGDVVCYEPAGNPDESDEIKDEPINKIRRQGFSRRPELDLCTCTAKKIWSVNETEALLKSWKETLDQVSPSYFIRSVSLCRRVSKNLHQIGIQKNWRQCQVKMKNLRREVRLYKESLGSSQTGRNSEVNNACEKLSSSIEEIFDKEEEIRRQWYEKREEHLKEENNESDNIRPVNSSDLLAEVATVMTESELGDEELDVAFTETDGVDDGGIETFVGSGGGNDSRIDAGPDATDATVVHHIIEAEPHPKRLRSNQSSL